MRKLKGIIFDMDGVITDTVPCHYRAWYRMFTEEGFYFDEHIYREKVDGKPRLEGISSVAINGSEEKLKEMASKKQRYFLASVEKNPPLPFQDAINLIKILKKENLKTAVASSSKNAALILNKIDIYNLFDEVITGCDFKRGKPDPEIFLTAADRLKVEPENCIVIEDAIEGVRAGLNAGIFTFGLARKENEMDLSHADMVIKSLDELSIQKIEKLLKEKL